MVKCKDLNLFYRRVLSAVLSLSIAYSPLGAWANTQTPADTTAEAADTQAVLAVTSVTSPDGKPVEISVTAIETLNEEKLIEQLAAQNPDGVIVLSNVATGVHADTKPVFEATQYVENPESKSFFGKIKNKFKSFVARNSERAKGTLIAISSASTGGFGAYYLAGSSLEHSAYLAASMFTVATLQATFTKTWSKYLANGGVTALKIGQVVTEKLNRQFSKPEWLANIGEIIAAASFNIAATSTILLLTDSFQSLTITALIGLLGAYDYTVDIATRRLMKDGKVTQALTEKTIKGRVMVGPVLETLSLAGFGPARIVMGVIGLAGIFAIFKGQSAYDALVASKGQLVKIQVKSRQVGTLIMRPQDALKLLKHSPDKSAAKNCVTLLQKTTFRQAVTDDMQ